MVVQDIEGEGGRLYSRLDLAKMLVLSGRTLVPGEHALMIFGENARLILPFTDDEGVFTSSANGLEALLYRSPTDIESAISTLEILYGRAPMRIVILTDGEDTISQSSSQTGEILTGKDITLIGIGTEA